MHLLISSHTEVEIEDESDDDMQYEAVPEDADEDDEVDFAKVLSTIKLQSTTAAKGTEHVSHQHGVPLAHTSIRHYFAYHELV